MKNQQEFPLTSKKDSEKKVVQTTADLVAWSIGASITLIGTSLSVIGGNIFAVVFSRVLGELAERFLSNRENARVGFAASLMIKGVQDKIDKNITVRQDDFFSKDQTNRSRADEICEGVLIKCKNEYEEKKILYVSNIYKNVAFDSSVNPDNANQILNSVERFSYRELLILAMVGQNIENKLSLRINNFRDNYAEVHTNLEFLLQDFFSLHSQGLITRNDNTAILDTSDIAPAIMKLTLIGNDYFKLLDLNTIPISEFYFLRDLDTTPAP